MKFYFVVLVWLLIAAVLVAGVALAAKGAFTLLFIGLIVFILALTRYGIYGH